MANYIGIIHKDADSDYGIGFPDFPGCISAGSTLEEAKDMGKEALEGHIELMIEDGDSIPEPSSLDDIMQSADFSDGVAVVIEHKKPLKTVRFNVTASDADLKEIDQYAQHHGYTRSGFLIKVAKNEIVRSNKSGHSITIPTLSVGMIKSINFKASKSGRFVERKVKYSNTAQQNENA